MPPNNRGVAQRPMQRTALHGKVKINSMPQLREGSEDNKLNSLNQVVQGQHFFSEVLCTWIVSVAEGV